MQLSLSGDNPLSYVNYLGNGVIFDPTNKTLQTPSTNILNSNSFDNALTELLDQPQLPQPVQVHWQHDGSPAGSTKLSVRPKERGRLWVCGAEQSLQHKRRRGL